MIVKVGCDECGWEGSEDDISYRYIANPHWPDDVIKEEVCPRCGDWRLYYKEEQVMEDNMHYIVVKLSGNNAGQTIHYPDVKKAFEAIKEIADEEPEIQFKLYWGKEVKVKIDYNITVTEG